MVAYFVLVHRYPNQFKKLFKAIYSPDDIYLVHVDKRAGDGIYADVVKFLASYQNAHLLKRQGINWGGYSMVSVELRAIKELLELSAKWSSYINLSGQDFPIKSRQEITKFLENNQGVNFMLVSDQKKERPITMNRIEKFFVEKVSGFTGKPTKRAFLKGVTPFIGGQWKILTRECCEFINSSPKIEKFKEFYKNTLIPDEAFFQTFLMNSGFNGKIVNDDKRAIIWIPDDRIKLHLKNYSAIDTASLVASGKIKLRPKIFTYLDMPFLKASTDLFARKFDETVDEKIFALIEANSLGSKLLMTNKRIMKLSGIGQVPLQEMVNFRVESFTNSYL